MADFLAGLNFISPPPSAHTSPENGTADPSRRSTWDLSAPVDADQVAAQLDAWTNVAFDFESIVGSAPGPSAPAFDRAFDRAPAVGDTGPGGRAAAALDEGAYLDAGFRAGIAPSSALSLHQRQRQRGDALTLTPASLGLLASADGGAGAGDDFFARPAPVPVPSMPSPLAAPASLPSKAARRHSHSVPHTTGVGTVVTGLGLDDDEENRKAIEEDKRRRNTAASARFRVKKKQREQALEQSERELRERVVYLEKELDAAKTENEWLRKLIIDRTGAPAVDEAGDDLAVATDADVLAVADGPSLSKRTRSD